jgi:hypothetical protein
MHRVERPMRARDSPVPLADITAWADVLQPAGFGEAIGVPLRTSDGRYLGVLGMHTGPPYPLTDRACGCSGR